MPCPKLMVMVSFCWKMNFLPSKLKNKFVLLTMSLKLTIKVVAFFLGHPVWNWTFSFYRCGIELFLSTDFQWSQWIHTSVQGLKTKISWLLCIRRIDALASKDTCSCFCFSCCFILPLSPTSILIFTAFPSALGHIAWFWDHLGLIVWTMPWIKQ